MTASTEHRVKASAAVPKLFSGLMELNTTAERLARAAGLEPLLLELIKIRASQINNCAFCIDMHTRTARKKGEDEYRIYALNAWRETPFFDERERAALALTEAITVLTDGFVPDDVYAAAAEVFTEEQLPLVIWAATIVNAWNRLGVSSKLAPGG